jgi:hypothetical protein
MSDDAQKTRRGEALDSLAQGLLMIGLVQTSMGQRSKDSSNEAGGALKPLAQITVYTFATAGTR